jgi:hypothetical protein
VVAPVDHVVNRSGEFEPELAGHLSTLREPRPGSTLNFNT